jgi:hypothetical protein
MSTIKADSITAKTTDGNLAITGNGSGKVALGDAALLFPDADGDANQVIATDGSLALSFANKAAGMTLGTEAATTSGTSHTFSSIPSGTKMIVINLQGVSFTATNGIDVTLGDSGGLETSGYDGVNGKWDAGAAGVISASTAAFSTESDDAADAFNLAIMLFLKDASDFTWICSYAGAINSGTDQVVAGGGSKSLSAELTQVSISGGTFDAGSANISYLG